MSTTTNSREYEKVDSKTSTVSSISLWIKDIKKHSFDASVYTIATTRLICNCDVWVITITRAMTNFNINSKSKPFKWTPISEILSLQFPATSLTGS